jgi:DNA modification methylase
MPEGYYSGDQPNSRLREFVSENATEYDLNSDRYAIGAFDEPITTTKATAIYNMHTYWSKKPHDAIRQYIRHYTTPGDVVLDPFCGSGGTALAALMESRKAIAIDRSPAATFITKNYCTPYSPENLELALSNVRRSVVKEMEWLYETKCDRCDGPATIGYIIYSEVFQCARCLARVPLFDCVVTKGFTAAGKPKDVKVCPHCYKKNKSEPIDMAGARFGAIPVRVNYICNRSCRPKRCDRSHNDINAKSLEYFERYDLGKLREIDETNIPYWYPRDRMMNAPEGRECWGLLWRNYLKGVERVDQFFTKQNLWALASWFHHVRKSGDPTARDLLTLSATANLPGLSIMNQYIPGATFPTKVLKGTYYVPPMRQVENVWNRLESKIDGLCRSLRDINAGVLSPSVMISTQSATKLDSIPTSSIDYIFTDPPYSWKVQYGEANFLWEAWLNLDHAWHAEEIIVNSNRSRTEDDWAALMLTAMKECFRVLKPGRWLSLCYHDSAEGTWEVVQDIMTEAGFIADTGDITLYIDAREKSQKQLVADNVTKRDLLINFRKPKPGESRFQQILIPANADVRTFTDLGQQVITDYLQNHPGATKDRVYDTLISSMVRKGQMEAHDFDALLRSVAEEVQEPIREDLFTDREADLFGSHVQSRWYLKETSDQIDHAEQAKEEFSAGRLGKFIDAYLKKNPEHEGVHYSDLFERYLPIHDKPRRLLADWLVEFFIKTTSGTWRLPNREEGEQLARLREAGTLRRIKRFANLLIEGVPIRDRDRPSSDVDLLEWLRQCRRAGLYDQGKAIYEKGGLNTASLSEEQQIEAEDDYRICVRRGSTEGAKPKRQRGNKQDDDE